MLGAAQPLTHSPAAHPGPQLWILHCTELQSLYVAWISSDITSHSGSNLAEPGKLMCFKGPVPALALMLHPLFSQFNFQELLAMKRAGLCFAPG